MIPCCLLQNAVTALLRPTLKAGSSVRAKPDRVCSVPPDAVTRYRPATRTLSPMSLEELNRSLFLLINGPADPGAAMLTFAKLCAALLVAAVPLYLVVGWLRGDEALRRRLLEAALACALGLGIAWVIGAVWPRPRPFMVGIGHALMTHAPNASFPSDHLTGIWSVAFSLLLQRGGRGAGTLLALLGLPVAWARIYLGIHFPVDMAGAALIAIFCAWALRIGAPVIVDPLFPWANTAYRRLFAPLIRRGWAAY